LEKLIKDKKVVIDNNDITRFCFSNVILKFDAAENVKPIKASNQNKIDGVISMIEALGAYLETP
jgi:phage terminase large subunit-like protein